MKTLIVKPSREVLRMKTIYSTDNTIHFSFCSKPDKNGVVKYHNAPQYCREAVIDNLRMYLNYSNGFYGWDEEYTDDECRLLRLSEAPQDDQERVGRWLKDCAIETKEARIFAYAMSNTAGKTLKKKMKFFRDSLCSARDFLNAIEDKKKGWKKTTIRKMEFDKDNSQNDFLYMIRGSFNWIKAPQMASLYLLLIRSFFNKEMHGAKTFEDVRDGLREIAKTRGFEESFGLDYLAEDLGLIQLFLDHEHEVFEGRTMFDNYFYGNNDEGKFAEDEGIHLLLRGESYSEDLNRRWEKVVEENPDVNKKAFTF